MLRRAALVLLLLVFSGIAAIFAAGHFGLRLPWEIAAPTAPDPASKDREQAAKPGEATEAAADKAETAVEEATAALGGAAPGSPAPTPGSVALDISRISPDGLSVFAGRAEPNSYVTVLENGKPAGTVKADAHGEWSLATEYKFASTDPKLTFEVTSTPPPEPAPATAAAEPAKPPAGSPSAAAVAGDVMRKFENLVSEAREAAAREKAEQEKAEQEKAEQAAKAASPPEQPSAGTTVAETAKEAAPPPALPEVTAPPAASADAASGVTTGSSASAEKAERKDADTAGTSVAAASEGSAPDKSASETERPAAIPVPIMFVYNEATLTPEGRRAADLLLEYLMLKRLSAVQLTGHADERGTHEYNFELSRERLDTVSDLLKRGGYSGELTLIPKGKTEPYMGVDRSKYHGEALHQLDRRVELRVTR